jgi:hypothetical protein
VCVGVAGQPTVLLGFVGVERVQDDVNFAVPMFGHDIVHEIQERSSPTSGIMPHLHLAGGDLQGCKQSARAVTLVAVG